MKAVVFSGTTEGRVFSRQLAALGAEVLVSVATPLGAEEQGKADGITVHCGRLTPEEMTALLQGAALCIDATHPYAVRLLPFKIRRSISPFSSILFKIVVRDPASKKQAFAISF